MNSVPILSTWVVGIINGIKREETLPNNIKYGTMGLSSGIMWFKLFYQVLPEHIPKNIMTPLLSATVGAPFIIGTTFCLGTYAGRAFRELDRQQMR